MIEITLTGMDAEDYISYRRSKVANVPVSVPVQTRTAPEAPVTTRVEAESKRFKDIVSSTKPTVNLVIDTATEWRQLVDSNLHVEPTRNAWSEKDLEIIRIAVGKQSPHYYSTATLARYLGRTESSVRSAAGRLGFSTKKGMLKYGK